MKRLIVFIMGLCMLPLLFCCGAPGTEAGDPGASREALLTEDASRYDRVDEVIRECNASSAANVSEPDPAPGAPLCVIRWVCRVDGNYIVYPRVENAKCADAINGAVRDGVLARAGELGACIFTEYRVEYNRNGIFSIRMFLYDLYGENAECLDCLPFTFNAETGSLCRISDFFSGGNNRWRGLIPDIITAQANDSSMVLLNDLLPISDDRKFYITDEAVVIMYDLYEISTYEAGEPEFEITVDDIADCIGEGSMLNAFIEPSPAPAESPQLTAAAAPGGTPPPEGAPPCGSPEPAGTPEPCPEGPEAPAGTPGPCPEGPEAPAETPEPGAEP